MFLLTLRELTRISIFRRVFKATETDERGEACRITEPSVKLELYLKFYFTRRCHNKGHE